MADLEVGLKGYAETMVDESNVASSVGSGLLDVFSTPSMIALMEKACKESVAPFLDEGQGTVGIRLEVDHLAATPIGQKVWVDSELIAVNKRILTFATSSPVVLLALTVAYIAVSTTTISRAM